MASQKKNILDEIAQNYKLLSYFNTNSIKRKENKYL